MKNKIRIIVFAVALFFAPSFAFAYTINSTGGDCALFGTWDGSTCTMTQDIAEQITIASDNITLDGAGYTTLGNGTSYSTAVYVSGSNPIRRANTTIKNLTMDNWGIGIHNNSASSTVIERNTFKNTTLGIKGSNTTYIWDGLPYKITIRNNTFENVTDGIFVANALEIALIEENTISSKNNGIDVSSGGLIKKVVIRDNTVESSSGSGTGITYGRGMSPWNPQLSFCFRTVVSPDIIVDIFGNTAKGFNRGINFWTNCTDILASIHDNVIENNALGVNFPPVNNGIATFSRNDFLNNARSIFFDFGNPYAPTTTISALLPEGGNYWSDYDDCNDANGDGFCDEQYVSGGMTTEIYWNREIGPIYLVDKYPYAKPQHTVPSALLENGGETENDGIPDTKGVADKTEFTFNVLYTGTTAPSDVTLWTNANDTTKSYALAISATTTNDGDFINGEWYTFTGTFPQGKYGYHFEANGGAARFPTEGELKFTTGYSNVAFLPGLEASRLYRNTPVFGEVMLWDPPIPSQNAFLFLNADGTSKYDNIYTKTGDIIDESYGFNIYKKFIDSMNQNVSKGIIREWKALPYDWRYDIDDIVDNPIQTHGGSYSMEEEIQALAENSDTGKVIIIGHSNGGLVGKALIKKLSENGKPNIAEKFIMVATPQIGTPQAMVALLHGEGLPSDMLPILMWRSTAQGLAENMTSAYNLLPSPEYFRQVLDPVASFSLYEQTANLYTQKYGMFIGNATELHSFLLGEEGRIKPDSLDSFTPNKLNSDLLFQSEQNHIWLDNWSPPKGVEMIQIAGWGLDTVSGINYKEIVVGDLGQKVLDHEPIMTSDGDGTVVVPSATASTTMKTYFVNLSEHNTELGVPSSFGFRRNREHKDILEVAGLQDQIKNIIQNVSKLETDIWDSKPPVDNTAKKLRLKVHSPISLDLYDSFGNHTGISTSTILGDDTRLIDEQIPNSYYMEVGEGKYAGTEANGTTTVKLFGQATGTFTLDVEEIHGDTVFASATFSDVPVNPNTQATFAVNTLAGANELTLDQNGDGIIDEIVFTDKSKETVTFQTLKIQIQALTTKTKPVLLVEVAVAEKQFNKGNYKAAKALLLVLKKEVEILSKQKIKNKWQIEKNDALRLFATIDALVEKVDKNIIKK